MKKFSLIGFTLVLMVASCLVIASNFTTKAAVCYATTACEDCFVRVVGKATRTVTADCAKVLVEIQSSGAEIFEAQANCETIYQDVLAMVEKLGMQTENVQAQRMFARRRFSTPEQCQAVLSLTVQICEQDKIADFENEINQIQGCRIVDVKYELDDLTQERESAINDAVQDATRKAHEILQQAEDGKIAAQKVCFKQNDAEIEINALVEMMY